MEKGDSKQEDYLYERNGKCSLFSRCGTAGWFSTNVVSITPTVMVCSVFIKELVDEIYPDADKIVLVVDNLNIEHAACPL